MSGPERMQGMLVGRMIHGNRVGKTIVLWDF